MTLGDARDLLLGSAIARAAFGDEVVEHYAHAADVEVTAFNAARSPTGNASVASNDLDIPDRITDDRKLTMS